MKISVITINRNDASGLEKTIRSVTAQEYSDVEYIVIDGASTDGSVDVIHAHAQHITDWHSEPDTGIYNAMNKGIAKATGDWLIFMNAGDVFAGNEVLSNFCSGDYKEDIVFGDQIRVMADGSRHIWTGPDKVDFLFFYSSGIPHQSTFTRKHVFEKHGGFREDYKIYSDWELTERAVLKHGASCTHIHLLVSIYDKTGVSSNPEQRHIRREEITASRSELFPSIVWEMAEECLKSRKELQIIKSHTLLNLILRLSKKTSKKIEKLKNPSKYISLLKKL